jgi:hypothetical protein
MKTPQPFNSTCSDDNTINNRNIKKVWTKLETQALIEAYKKYEKDFKGSTKKNDTIWSELASEMRKRYDVTTNQCKDRWKYIKIQYYKKKDNKRKETGTSPRKFAYEEEMDEIFAQKPNLNPVAIASSSRESTSESYDTDDELVLQTKVLNDSTVKQRKRRETEAEGRERRYKERLEKQTEAITTYKEMMSKLLEKL